MMSALKKLWQMSPRIWRNEEKTRAFILSLLKEKSIEPYVQEYFVHYPVFEEFYLFVDGEKVPVLPSSLTSGRIREKNLIDSFEAFIKDLEPKKPSINYNPFCKSISTPIFFEKPSLAISRKFVDLVIKSEDMDGRIRVSWKRFRSSNILVGNLKDPLKIFFVHYDSLWGGVIDNGVAVSLILELLPRIDLKRNLVVFSGSEELSHEFPIYWGYGFRVFEKEFFDLLENSERIIVVDSVGYSETKILKGKEILDLFPVRDPLLFKKTVGIAGDIREIFPIYHSWEDNIEKIRRDVILSTRDLIIKLARWKG